MHVDRRNRYFSLANDQGFPVGTTWYATEVAKEASGDFYITNHAIGTTRKVDFQHVYFSLHLPTLKHKDPQFSLRLPKHKIKESGFEVATTFPFREKLTFPGEMIDEKCWHVVRLSWSYRLQQRKYWSVSRARYPLPTLDKPNDGFQMRELLRLNSYWKLDFYLSVDSPYKLPGAAFGLANSQNEQEAVTQLTSSSLGNQYFLTSVSSIASGLRRPIPEYCQAPPSPKGQATMVSRADIDSSGFYWVHETITTKDFKDHLKETTHKVI